MVFSSLLFLYVFLPLNLAFYALAKDIRTKNTVMLIFSLVFYAWGEPVYVLLLVGMALADWFLSHFIGKNRGTGKAKLGLVLACAIDLGLLAVFKYTGFLLGNAQAPVSYTHLDVYKRQGLRTADTSNVNTEFP